jgi:hypothetical protein
MGRVERMKMDFYSALQHKLDNPSFAQSAKKSVGIRVLSAPALTVLLGKYQLFKLVHYTAKPFIST